DRRGCGRQRPREGRPCPGSGGETTPGTRKLSPTNRNVWGKTSSSSACWRSGREGEALCARLGNRAWQSRLPNTIGWTLAEVGNPVAALPINLEAARLARELGDPEILANSEINLAMNHLDLGDVDRAAAVLTPFEATIDTPGDPWMRWRYTLHIRDAAPRIA